MGESDSIFGAPEKPTRAKPAKPTAVAKTVKVDGGKRTNAISTVVIICIFGGFGVVVSAGILYKMFEQRPVASNNESRVEELQRLIDTMPTSDHPGRGKSDIVQRTNANKWAEGNLPGKEITINTFVSGMEARKGQEKYTVWMQFGRHVHKTTFTDYFCVGYVTIDGANWDVLINTGHQYEGASEEETMRLTNMNSKFVALKGVIQQPHASRFDPNFGFQNILNFMYPGNFRGTQDNVLLISLGNTAVVAR